MGWYSDIIQFIFSRKESPKIPPATSLSSRINKAGELEMAQSIVIPAQTEQTFSHTFKGGPRINKLNELEMITSSGNRPKGFDKVRWGNIVYYEDVPGCGYPISINLGFWTQPMVDSFSFDTVITSTGDAWKGRSGTTKHVRMAYRFSDFFEQNSHLLCKPQEIPAECEYLHQFQNWYEDTYGHQPKIYRVYKGENGDVQSLMNKDYFIHNLGEQL